MADEWLKRDPDDGGEYLELPPNPDDLTRELALKVFAHPEVLIATFARLAQSLAQQGAKEEESHA